MAKTHWRVRETALAEGFMHVILVPVAGGEDDNVYWTGDPKGRVEIMITNPDSSTLFENGNDYVLELTQAP
jgi:hypothetical protein